MLMNVRSRRPDGSEELRLIGPVVAWSAGAFRTFLAGVDRCAAEIDHAGDLDHISLTPPRPPEVRRTPWPFTTRGAACDSSATAF